MIGALLVMIGGFMAAAGADTCDSAILHGIGSESAGMHLLIAGAVVMVIGFVLADVSERRKRNE